MRDPSTLLDPPPELGLRVVRSPQGVELVRTAPTDAHNQRWLTIATWFLRCWQVGVLAMAAVGAVASLWLFGSAKGNRGIHVLFVVIFLFVCGAMLFGSRRAARTLRLAGRGVLLTLAPTRWATSFVRVDPAKIRDIVVAADGSSVVAETGRRPVVFAAGLSREQAAWLRASLCDLLGLPVSPRA